MPTPTNYTLSQAGKDLNDKKTSATKKKKAAKKLGRKGGKN